MMRSLFSGVSGLKVHQTKMDVIGNNIANVNTTSYKSMSINFSELMYQTSAKASGPNPTVGTAGKNPKQIGLGVVSGAISTAVTSAGSAQTTNNPFDIRISGDSFFIVSDGNNNHFTRDGSFFVDAAGNLAMTSTGYNVMGWKVDEDTGKIKQDTVTALRIMSQEFMTYAPEYTSKANISGIVDKKDTDINSPSGKTINLPIYDNLGYSYTVKLSLHKANADGEYYLQMKDILDSEGKSISEYYGVPIDTIAKLGASTDVRVNDNYNPLTETMKVDVTTGTPAVTTTQAITRSVTFDPTGNGSYKVSFKNDSGVVLKETGNGGTQEQADALTAALAACGVTAGDLGGQDANGYFTISRDDLVTAATAADDVAEINTAGTNVIKLLSVLFGDSVDETVKAGTIDKLNNGRLTISDRTIQGGLIKYDTTNGAFISANGNATGLTIDFADTFTKDGVVTNLGNFHDVDIDMTTTKQSDNGGSAAITADSGDLNGLGSGRKLGDMSGITISDDGRIYASYDNGMSRLLGQIAVAQFANASGLEKIGDNLYDATLNSGDFDGIGVDIKANGGAMNSGQLEMSNVDLSTEFTQLITTQRGFQANSRIISVSDSLLEELVNLKR